MEPTSKTILIMKRSFKQLWSTIPSISTKQKSTPLQTIEHKKENVSKQFNGRS
jgi:hypothetical protein